MKIEKTFIINLPDRLDRLIPLIDICKEYGFDYSVFSAIKNKENPKQGLVDTIEKLFYECVNEGYSTIAVLEDDCRFLINPIDTIQKCLSQLPVQYDCLYLGCNLWQEHIYKYSSNLIQLYDSYATHSIVYSKKGMLKVLEAINNIEIGKTIPLDILIKQKIMVDKNCFCSFPILTTQENGWSDIEGKDVNYKKFLQERFEERTKHL